MDEKLRKKLWHVFVTATTYYPMYFSTVESRVLAKKHVTESLQREFGNIHNSLPYLEDVIVTHFLNNVSYFSDIINNTKFVKLIQFAYQTVS